MTNYVKLEPEDDFITSYLNPEYLTDMPLSPPDSSSSFTGSPEKQVSNDFLLDMNTDLLSDWMNPYLLADTPKDLMGSLFPPEEPAGKKKRGRKKREVLQPVAQPSLLAPRPLTVPPLAEVKQTQEVEKEAQLAKRQERLIKNRAAALLSRKRKREHLDSLEEENKKLIGQVDELEKRVQTLEKENSELKQKLGGNTSTGFIFMIFFFSFALFALPSRTINNQLTVGGSSSVNKQYPLIDSASYSAITPFCEHGDCNQQSTDLVLIDSVRPRDLQTWINRKLEKTENNEQSHLYLYSKEFSQMASVTKTDTHKGNPVLSLISPYNQTADICDRYLQIDVQVLGSKVIDGHLMSLQQFDYPSALLDGMKKDLITYPRIKKKQDKIVSPKNNTKSRVLIS